MIVTVDLKFLVGDMVWYLEKDCDVEKAWRLSSLRVDFIEFDASDCTKILYGLHGWATLRKSADSLYATHNEACAALAEAITREEKGKC